MTLQDFLALYPFQAAPLTEIKQAGFDVQALVDNNAIKSTVIAGVLMFQAVSSGKGSVNPVATGTKNADPLIVRVVP